MGSEVRVFPGPPSTGEKSDAEVLRKSVDEEKVFYRKPFVGVGDRGSLKIK